MVENPSPLGEEKMLEVPEGDEKDVPTASGFKAILNVWDSFIASGSISAGAFESNSIRRARRIPRLAAGGLSIVLLPLRFFV
jgi:hypothetical protein